MPTNIRRTRYVYCRCSAKPPCSSSPSDKAWPRLTEQRWVAEPPTSLSIVRLPSIYQWHCKRKVGLQLYVLMCAGAYPPTIQPGGYGSANLRAEQESQSQQYQGHPGPGHLPLRPSNPPLTALVIKLFFSEGLWLHDNAL
jgi:hypothetical protein